MNEFKTAVEMLCAHTNTAFLVLEDDIIRYSSINANKVLATNFSSLEGVNIEHLIPNFKTTFTEFYQLYNHTKKSSLPNPTFSRFIEWENSDGIQQSFQISLKMIIAENSKRLLISMTESYASFEETKTTKNPLSLLFSAMLHDLNSVLTAILGHASLCELRDVSEFTKIKEHIKTIIGASERATVMTREMMKRVKTIDKK